MKLQKKRLAMAGAAVMAVCLSIVFVRMIGGLQEQKITPTPVPTPVVQTTPMPTASPKASSTPIATPTATPTATPLPPTPTPSVAPTATPEPVYEPETDPEILEVYEQNTQDREEIQAQQKPAEIITEEDREEAENPKPTPKPVNTSKPTSKPSGTSPKPTPTPPKSVWLSDVPFIDQRDQYPTGCESVSAVMACQYAGISITPDTFIDQYLPRASFTYQNGKLVGYHPNDCFMGNPYTSNGFGCYAPCIEKAIRKFLPSNYTMTNTTGSSVSSLCKNYIDRGIPVVIWATMSMVAPGNGATWILKDTGKTFQWLSHEHCLVLTGYDSQYYFFNDPLQGKVKYKKSLVETRYQQMGSQSLVVYENSQPEPTPTPTPVPTPTPTPSLEPEPTVTPVPQETPVSSIPEENEEISSVTE